MCNEALAMKPIHNWKDVLRRAWSVRLMLRRRAR